MGKESIEDSLRFLLRTARSRQIRAILDFTKEYKLSFPHMSILHHLAHHGTMNVGEMENFLGVSKAAVSQMLDKFVAAGLVTRKEDPDDRRIKLAELSPRGRDILTRMHRESHEWVGELLGNLDDEETRIVSEGVALLSRKLKEIEEKTTDEVHGKCSD
jgi:DNA-binding MarR family transcriptional regulator